MQYLFDFFHNYHELGLVLLSENIEHEPVSVMYCLSSLLAAAAVNPLTVRILQGVSHQRAVIAFAQQMTWG